MSIIQIEVTDDNEFNDGWLRYLLGMDRPVGERDEDGRFTAAQNGWDMGLDTPQVKIVRHVFTRQNDIDHPQYIVREVAPPKPKRVTTNVGPDQQDEAHDIAKEHAAKVAGVTDGSV